MRVSLNLVTALMPALAISYVQAQPGPDAYTFTKPSLLPGSTAPLGSLAAINSDGDACGTSSFLSTEHAFLLKKGAAIDLGAQIGPDGPTWSICTAISKYAPVGFGFHPADYGAVRALVFGGEYYPLPPIPIELPLPQPPPDFVPNSYAYAINDSGDIAGSYNADKSVDHAIVWHPHGLSWTHEDLNSGECPDWVFTSATGINKSGQVIGVGLHKGAFASFLLTPGMPMCSGITDIGSLSPPPFDYTVAMGINDEGQVVGYSSVLTPAGPRHHAFLWAHGKMKDLGVPPPLFPAPVSPLAAIFSIPTTYQNSVATAINNNGKIVGLANMSPFPSIIYTATDFGWGSALMYDTNKGVKPPSTAWSTGWNHLNNPAITKGLPKPGPMGPPTAPWPMMPLIAAFAINDMDEIAGAYATPASAVLPYLLTTPLPLKP